MDTPASQAFASALISSDAFDYNSIMIYDGDLMSSRSGKYVLYRREANGKAGPPVWMGGGVNGKLEATKLSEGDIARVAALYDDGTGEKVEGGEWGPVRVKVRDRLDVVVPAPRKRDEL